jgi:two-component system, chemotaxis family, response regulator WspF
MKIGIVNDLPMAVEALRRALALSPRHEVIWTANDGAEAVARCAQQRPDLVLMDLIMPGMDGVEATRRIMASTPCTILIVTVSVDINASRVFEAMGYGALDAVDTPILGSGDLATNSAPFLAKLDTIARLLGDGAKSRSPVTFGRTSPTSRHALVAIGASAGGPAALAMLLEGLPRSFPAALVIIQHVDERFVSGLAEWLRRHSALPVRLAEEGDRPLPGTVLLAGTGDHLTLKAADRLGYTAEPRDYAYRPSVDVFFQSVGTLWPGKAIGVLLTGMGADGALGLKALRAKGHYTIAQDQASSAVYGMPKAAAAAKAAVDILPLQRIAPKIVDALAPPVEKGVIA